jgi:hypothetical protein
MDREDRIRELQQALANLDQTRWASFLEAACPDDASMRGEVLRRHRALVEEAPTDPPLSTRGNEEGPQFPDSTV